MPLDPLKTCTKCGVAKDRSLFCSDSSKSDCLYSSCKACKAVQHAEYQRAHPEQFYEHTKKWRAKNAEKHLATKARWAAENKDRIRAQQMALYFKNHEKSLAKLKLQRAARRSGGARKLYPEVVLKLKTLQKSKCAICLVNLDDGYHLDHIMPLKLGGSNDGCNYQLLCPSCNIKKRDHHPIDYMQKLGRLL